MGEVYRARDTRLDRSVAIKILPAHLSADSARKLRFEREAKTVSALNHPNICSLFDVGSQDGTDFLVMECIEGENLADRLAKGPLPTEQVLKIGTEIADAIAKAHRSGVVHRDLKPGNIMLTKTGAKLLDFGLAKPAVASSSGLTLTDVPASSPVTGQGVIVGTFQYMSPEQVEGKELDGRSDIFSLGAVLYEMLTGQRAFAGKIQFSVASAILERDPTPITTIKPLTPRNLDHVVRRCLAKDPDDRWQSARDLALELKSISSADPFSSSAAALPVHSRRARTEFIAWSVAALALLAAAAIFFLRPNHPNSGLPLYSSIVPPLGTSFEIEGDLGKQPALSPDGTSLIFGASGELYLHSFSTGTDRVITGAHGGVNPFWSPDGTSIGFFADFKVKTLDLNTGVVRILCDAPSPRGGSWGSSGMILFAPSPRDAIFQVSANGGTPTAVTSIDTKLHSTHRWPYFLPDGQHFLYYASNHAAVQNQQNGIYIASLDGKLNRFLVNSPAAGLYSRGDLLYAKESGLLAQPLDLHSFSLTGSPRPLLDNIVVDLGIWHLTVSASSSSDNLVYQTGSAMALSRLEWVGRSGAHLSYLGDKGVYNGPRLSKDGQRFLITYGDPSHDVWLSIRPALTKPVSRSTTPSTAKPLGLPTIPVSPPSSARPTTPFTSSLAPLPVPGNPSLFSNKQITTPSPTGLPTADSFSPSTTLPLLTTFPPFPSCRAIHPVPSFLLQAVPALIPADSFLPTANSSPSLFFFLPGPKSLSFLLLVATACGRFPPMEDTGPVGAVMASNSITSTCATP